MKDRLRLTRRVKVASGGTIATLAMLSSALVGGAVSSASAVEAPAAAPTVKQSTMVKERPSSKQDASPLRCYRNCYGSIQISRVGHWGKAYNYRSIDRAKRLAHRNCRRAADFSRPCFDMGWALNSCLAVAVRWDGHGRIIRAKTNAPQERASKRGAYRRALRNCRADGGRCTKLPGAWFCTANRG